MSEMAYSNLFSMLEDQYVDDEKPSYQIRIRFFGAGVIFLTADEKEDTEVRVHSSIHVLHASCWK